MPRLLRALPLAALALAGCASEPASGSSEAAVIAAPSLEERVTEFGAALAAAGGDRVYLVTDRFTDGELRGELGPPLAGEARRSALAECAVYGGGRAQASEDPYEVEDLERYIDAAGRAALAAELDRAIGPADVHRVDSFGIGDPGDDFSARCTVAVRLGPGELLLLQGHGRDSLLFF